MGLTLLSFGNSQRRDDGIASVACRRLVEELPSGFVNWYDLGIHTEQVSTFLKDKSDVLIVDALKGFPVGRVVVMDLDEQLASHRAQIRQCHGLSWLDEIALSKSGATITFIGINVVDDGWGEGLSEEATQAMPEVVRFLVDFCKAKECRTHA
jgi:hydrogenase maturation protease